MVTKPRVLLLDEPLSALDRRLRQDMQVELRRIQRESGLTTIFVTHDQEEALTLSDTIAILDRGRIIQEGNPAEIYERPKSRFAASFLGDANLFTGRVEGDAIAIDGGHIRMAGKPPEGATVTVAIRPEKMRIARAGEDALPGENRLEATVKEIVYAGAVSTYLLERGGAQIKLIAQNRETQAATIGDTVTLLWSPTHTVLLQE